MANLVSFRFGRDQGIYAVVGEAILRGKAPYKDAWDFKPPAVYFVYAIAQGLFGSSQTSIRILEAILWATVPVLFARFVKNRGGDGRLGFFGGVLAVYIHVRKEYWHTSQPESFGAVFLLAALVLVDAVKSAAPTRSTLARWALAGALFGASALLKPHLGGGVLLLPAVWLWERRATIPKAERRKTILSCAIATGSGFVLPFLFTVLFFRARGAWDDLVDTLFRFAPMYTKLDTRLDLLHWHVARALSEVLYYFTPMLLGALLVLTRSVPSEMRRKIGALPILAVITAPFFGIALQGKFFPYHYDGILLFVCFFAMAGYSGALASYKRLGVPNVALLGLLVVIGYGFYELKPWINPGSIFWDRVPQRVNAALHPSQRTRISDELTNEADTRSAENRRLSNWIEESIPKDQSVFLWGFEPVVYLTSGRRPATRYIYDVPQRVGWSRGPACMTLELELAADPPAAIAVEHDDRFVHVIGNANDSFADLGSCAWLPPLLARDYVEVWKSSKWTTYLRRTR